MSASDILSHMIYNLMSKNILTEKCVMKWKNWPCIALNTRCHKWTTPKKTLIPKSNQQDACSIIIWCKVD